MNPSDPDLALSALRKILHGDDDGWGRNLVDAGDPSILIDSYSADLDPAELALVRSILAEVDQ